MSKDAVKVHVALPNHWAIGGEALWALHVGHDLFRLENVPFWAYGLNFGDLVEATADENGVLVIRQVVTKSGHATLRVMFNAPVSREQATGFLDGLHPLGVSYEQETGLYFALDLQPGASMDAVRDALDAWAEDDRLAYETCQARVPGSFDDEPPDAVEGSASASRGPTTR